MKVRDKTRTSAEARVPTTQSTSKNHNYFYTHQNEVIQNLKYSYGCLVSMKNTRKIQTQLYQTQKYQNRNMFRVLCFFCFSFPSQILDHDFTSLLTHTNKT